MPDRDPPDPEALRVLVESAQAELESMFFTFYLDSPAERTEIVHDCAVRLSLEWHKIEIDRKLWFLAEVEGECRRRSDLSPPRPRSEWDDLLP